MSDLIVRCSSIGKLMAAPLNADLDPEFLTPELQAIIAKTKRTDSEKLLLDDARRNSLSAGGKTHVRALLREAIYGFEPAELNTRPILKGRQVEGACIEMLSRLTGRPLVKNSERRTNGLITGECDVFDAPIRHGRDVKAPYSMESMPIVLADAYDSDYEFQMQGYQILWDAETWSVDYLLVSTPEELVGFEPPSLHYVDHIAEHLRWTSWLVNRNRAIESLIVDKVLAARRYYAQALNDFDRTHTLPGELVGEFGPTDDLAAPPWTEPTAPAAAPARITTKAADVLPTF